MIAPASPLQPHELEAVLSGTLQQVHGSDARLSSWTADRSFTKNGKRRVVRYDLDAYVAGFPDVQRYRWLGKFYDRDEDAQRVASVLRQLAAIGDRPHDAITFPRVLSYHGPQRLLLLTYEPGEPVLSAIERDPHAVLASLGRALAALHRRPIVTEGTFSPNSLLDDLRPKTESLCFRFPADADGLRGEFSELERTAPLLPGMSSFVHGDFGPANLLRRDGKIVVLDFDKCGHGDPALDLANLLVQLRRITIRKPEKLRDFVSSRRIVVDAYRSSGTPGEDLDRRLEWYERAILLLKIHRQAFNATRDQDPEAIRHRQFEAQRLLSLLSPNRTPTTAPRPLAVGPPWSVTVDQRPQQPDAVEGVFPAGFPFDDEFPHLPVASDPRRMLLVFRENLKPFAGKAFRILECTPFRFRCRQSTSRCVLQYALRIAEDGTGREWDQWVTAILYADPGEAERVWEEMQASDPHAEIPEAWRTFEPFGFIPHLRMVWQVFPYDRKLPDLRKIMDDGAKVLDSLLMARFGAGPFQVETRTIEPTRYRTELQAALRYTVRARDTASGRSEEVRCYLKVYRNERGAETWRLFHALPPRLYNGNGPYGIVGPITYLNDLKTLAIEEAPGRVLSELLLDEVEPARLLRQVAHGVAAFNLDDLPIQRRESLADQLDDLRRASALVQWACPETREKVQGITASVVRGLREQTLAPIHADLKPDHIFLAGDCVWFIDLDSAVLGDPVRDPAHLYAYLAAGVGLDTVPVERIHESTHAFVEEYFRVVPESWRARFPLHCAGALVEVASGIFRRQEARWREKVVRALARAERVLSEGVP